MEQEKMFKDILETVNFLKDNMVSEERFTSGLATTEERLMRQVATKDDLQDLKSDIMTHMDGFIGLHQKLDLELVAMRAKYERLEDQIQQLARHAKLELN